MQGLDHGIAMTYSTGKKLQFLERY
ncbi:hypothetical protein EYZ11_012853 [Aspergillus tanneri]|uniref:Uncharacterized protein n=1 Tax=Aspergillus tanneri TaxID=1220188 RepID=A0A4S3J1A0_9EURO|nr:hypothetical protein EYZ11_012853 [Aspergillus tanneri]